MIIFLNFTLIIRIYKVELVLISMRVVLKLCNSKSFNVIMLFLDFKTSFLIKDPLISYK